MSTILGIAGVIGAALAVLLTVSVRTTLSLLRDDNSDLRSRVSTLEQREHDCVARVTDLEQRLAEMAQQNAVLRDLATGQSAIAALGTQLEGWYRDLVARLERA